MFKKISFEEYKALFPKNEQEEIGDLPKTDALFHQIYKSQTKTGFPLYSISVYKSHSPSKFTVSHSYKEDVQSWWESNEGLPMPLIKEMADVLNQISN